MVYIVRDLIAIVRMYRAHDRRRDYARSFTGVQPQIADKHDLAIPRCHNITVIMVTTFSSQHRKPDACAVPISSCINVCETSSRKSKQPSVASWLAIIDSPLIQLSSQKWYIVVVESYSFRINLRIPKFIQPRVNFLRRVIVAAIYARFSRLPS